ncbi:GNAT family N-acetyltransferase [Azospirillum sp. sgz302134]
MSADVKNNAAMKRYELTVNGATAFVTYALSEGRIALLHTEVPESLSGQGIGSALARGALDDARASGRKVVPHCTFMAGYIKRHPEYQDLVAEPGPDA